jgi:hypothetical protein
MSSLEQRLIDKCSALDIALFIKKESISIDVESPRVFGTNGLHWEYCSIIQQRNSRRFNYEKERNDSIRAMLNAIETIRILIDGEQCAEGDDCEECGDES